MRGFAAIGLHKPKNAANVGGVLRAAGCYGAALVLIDGRRDQRLIKASTNTLKTWRHIPHVWVSDLKSAVPVDAKPIAVDLIPGSTNLCDFVHPESAFYVFGPEDGTLGESVTDWCAEVVSVPTRYCMNLAATVNVVLYDRLSKQDARRHSAA